MIFTLLPYRPQGILPTRIRPRSNVHLVHKLSRSVLPVDRADLLEPNHPKHRMDCSSGADRAYPGNCDRGRFGSDAEPAIDRVDRSRSDYWTLLVAFPSGHLVDLARLARHRRHHDHWRA